MIFSKTNLYMSVICFVTLTKGWWVWISLCFISTLPRLEKPHPLYSVAWGGEKRDNPTPDSSHLYSSIHVAEAARCTGVPSTMTYIHPSDTTKNTPHTRFTLFLEATSERRHFKIFVYCKTKSTWTKSTVDEKHGCVRETWGSLRCVRWMLLRRKGVAHVVSAISKATLSSGGDKKYYNWILIHHM